MCSKPFGLICLDTEEKSLVLCRKKQREGKKKEKKEKERNRREEEKEKKEGAENVVFLVLS